MWSSQYITDEIIAQYEHPRFKLVVDGTEEIYENMLEGSVSLKLGCSDSSRFDVGGCVVGSLSFTIADFDARFNGYFFNESTIDLYVGYGSSVDSAEYVEFGHFKVAEATRNQSIISITAYDALRDADKVEFVYNGNAATLTTNEIITIAAGLANITVGTLPSNTITVDTSTFTKMTCRQAMQYAMEASGNFAYINHLGQLTCRWFDLANPIKTFDDSFGSTFSENWTYTGVMVNGELTGTDGYVYSLSNNPFVNDSNKSAVAQRLYSILYDQGFYEASITVPLADPRIEPGDVVTVYEYGPMNTKTARIMPVTNITFKSELAETLSCSAASADTLDDLRQTETQKAENAVSPADVQDMIDQRMGDYIPVNNGSGYGTELYGTNNGTSVKAVKLSGYSDNNDSSYATAPRIHGGLVVDTQGDLESGHDANIYENISWRFGSVAGYGFKRLPQCQIFKRNLTSQNVKNIIIDPLFKQQIISVDITPEDFVEQGIPYAQVQSTDKMYYSRKNYTLMNSNVKSILHYHCDLLLGPGLDARGIGIMSYLGPVIIRLNSNIYDGKSFTFIQYLDRRIFTDTVFTLADINEYLTGDFGIKYRLTVVCELNFPDPE